MQNKQKSEAASYVNGRKKADILESIKSKLIRKHGDDPITIKCIDDCIE